MVKMHHQMLRDQENLLILHQIEAGDSAVRILAQKEVESEMISC